MAEALCVAGVFGDGLVVSGVSPGGVDDDVLKVHHILVGPDDFLHFLEILPAVGNTGRVVETHVCFAGLHFFGAGFGAGFGALSCVFCDSERVRPAKGSALGFFALQGAFGVWQFFCWAAHSWVVQAAEGCWVWARDEKDIIDIAIAAKPKIFFFISLISLMDDLAPCKGGGQSGL